MLSVESFAKENLYLLFRKKQETALELNPFLKTFLSMMCFKILSLKLSYPQPLESSFYLLKVKICSSSHSPSLL